MAKHNFKELIVWQKARQLVIDTYKITAKFPVAEKYSLISQINRSAVSISSNIAEGAGRNTNKDFSRFIDIAKGSAYELESQIINSVDLEFISKSDAKKIYDDIIEIQKLLFGFQKVLK